MFYFQFLKSSVTALTLAVLGIAQTSYAAEETALIAGGCFWCVESDFESVKGVSKAVSGYSGGASENPTYKELGDHLEAVQVTFDSSMITYAKLLHKFLRSIDVTDAEGQFCDRGYAYSTAIFVLNDEQEAIAKAVVAEAEADLGQKVVTPIIRAGKFWPAEDYHQDYYKGKNYVLTRRGPKRQDNAYRFYRISCGRDARIAKLWGDAAPFTTKYLKN